MEGYRVWTAQNGLQGFSTYYQHKAQTVLTDIDMPELDGFEMMRCIRAINPCARAIYMSGAPERYRRALVAETENFGATILRKPFKGTALLTLVSSSSITPAIHELNQSEESHLEESGTR
jgi:YesN/AraC family two-component response regulator